MLKLRDALDMMDAVDEKGNPVCLQIKFCKLSTGEIVNIPKGFKPQKNNAASVRAQGGVAHTPLPKKKIPTILKTALEISKCMVRIK